MGSLDAVAKEYMSRNDRFADAFNFFIYDGEQVIKPEMLKELDPTEISIPFGDMRESSVENGTKKNRKNEKPVQMYRDLLKSWKIMSDDKAIYVLLGAELQGKVHYAMPVRNLLYDAMNYSEQVKLVSQKNRKSADKKVQSAEFLSGFKKDDRLLPVITLTIYFGADEWDGPKTLREMFGKDHEEFVKFIPDYTLNLIEPHGIKQEDFPKFRSKLGEVLEYIKFSNDAEKLDEGVRNNEGFKSVDIDTVRLINEATHWKFEVEDEKEDYDMCKALLDMQKNHEKIGEERGRIEGIREGRLEGRLEGKIEGKLELLVNLVNDEIITCSEAAKRAGMSKEEFMEKYLKK